MSIGIWADAHCTRIAAGFPGLGVSIVEKAKKCYSIGHGKKLFHFTRRK